MPKYYRTKEDRESYFIKSTDPQPSINQLGSRLIEANTGKEYINIDGVWVLDLTAQDSTYIQTSGTSVNIADSFYKDEQIVGELSDRELRDGNMYAVGYMWSTVASNGLCHLHIKSGANPIYFSYEISSTALMEYYATKSPTVSANGTLVSPFNRNMVSTKTPLSLVYRDATFTGGTVLVPRFLGVGGNPTNRSGGSSTSQFAIVPANTSLIITCKNVSGATMDRIGIYMNWFEITRTI